MRNGNKNTVDWDVLQHSDDESSDDTPGLCVRCGKTKHKDYAECVIPTTEEIEKETEEDISFAVEDMAKAKNLSSDMFGYLGYTQSVEMFPTDKSFRNTQYCFNCGC